jgi:hypothetical protein
MLQSSHQTERKKERQRIRNQKRRIQKRIRKQFEEEDWSSYIQFVNSIICDKQDCEWKKLHLKTMEAYKQIRFKMETILEQAAVREWSPSSCSFLSLRVSMDSAYPKEYIHHIHLMHRLLIEDPYLFQFHSFPCPRCSFFDFVSNDIIFVFENGYHQYHGDMFKKKYQRIFELNYMWHSDTKRMSMVNGRMKKKQQERKIQYWISLLPEELLEEMIQFL